MNLDGRRALVTGGAGHIGLAISESLIELGATIPILDSNAAACQERAEKLNKIRANFGIALPCDLEDESATRGAVVRAIHQMGGLDVLIHCAAYVGTTQAPGWAVPFDDQTVGAWDVAFQVNLTSAFVMVKEARKALSDSGHGSVILFGSTYGLVGPVMSLYEDTGMENAAGYAASKGG